jgi:hypothetical protein
MTKESGTLIPFALLAAGNWGKTVLLALPLERVLERQEGTYAGTTYGIACIPSAVQYPAHDALSCIVQSQSSHGRNTQQTTKNIYHAVSSPSHRPACNGMVRPAELEEVDGRLVSSPYFLHVHATYYLLYILS